MISTDLLANSYCCVLASICRFGWVRTPLAAYRWQREDPDFAEQWYEAHENAVDVVESTLYQQAIGGNTLAGFFYLKAHRPIYRDRVSIDVEQVKGEIGRTNGAARNNPTLARTS